MFTHLQGFQNKKKERKKRVVLHILRKRKNSGKIGPKCLKVNKFETDARILHAKDIQ